MKACKAEPRTSWRCMLGAVVFEARSEKLMLTPVVHRTARDLRGALKVGHPSI